MMATQIAAKEAEMTATLDILTTTTTDGFDDLSQCPWSDPDTTVTPEIAKLAALLAQSYTGRVLFA